ncbi:hypothetical protein Pst134EA_029295 [Puccinia striiformis f. sp. tritici]|uniref:hypothetical protein n=1 Tax=Puccinia striiformis f. sp. tritici TaxID=168172 RepID=UPI0020084754|nr:hypothetical protein Pst134EA_029295 [Puccinia striiformis f. sp. tritici]KAH9447261.1 hypothetical protein Pst134EA_029295 [Puccinia striiformis f. sp. tritici]
MVKARYLGWRTERKCTTRTDRKERKLGELERQQEASRAGRRRQERNQETTTKDLITAQSSSTPSTSETIPVSTAQEPIKTTKKRKQKSKTSAGIEEKFLRGERSDSEDPETSEQPRKSGGLNEFMKDVKQRASQGRNTSRQLEWEWKPNMGVSRRKFFL